jgi:hypothetical protein
MKAPNAHALRQSALFETAVAHAVDWAQSPPSETRTLLKLQAAIHDLHVSTGLSWTDERITGQSVMDAAMDRIQAAKDAAQ